MSEKEHPHEARERTRDGHRETPSGGTMVPPNPPVVQQLDPPSRGGDGDGRGEGHTR